MSQKETHLTGGKGRDEADICQSPTLSPVLSARGIKHMHNVCGERTGLVQGMSEVPEAGYV